VGCRVHTVQVSLGCAGRGLCRVQGVRFRVWPGHQWVRAVQGGRAPADPDPHACSRRLLCSATSSAEAREYLRENPDTRLVLLDDGMQHLPLVRCAWVLGQGQGRCPVVVRRVCLGCRGWRAVVGEGTHTPLLPPTIGAADLNPLTGSLVCCRDLEIVMGGGKNLPCRRPPFNMEPVSFVCAAGTWR